MQKIKTHLSLKKKVGLFFLYKGDSCVQILPDSSEHICQLETDVNIGFVLSVNGFFFQGHWVQNVDGLAATL